MLKIVTDSAADLPPEVVRDLDIKVVPLSIHFGNNTYIDGEDIDSDAFYRMLRTDPHHPRTAQPSAGRFEAAFRSLSSAGHDIMAVTLSSTLSGTFNSATLAARSVPEACVTLVDSRAVSMATGSMVVRAAHLSKECRPLAEISATVQDMIPRLNIFILVDTLTYLQRGGRIGRAGSLVGTMLDIKPILTLRDGEVVPIARVRTRDRALKAIANLVAAQAPLEELYIMHAAAAGDAAALAAMLRQYSDNGDIPTMPLGPVAGVHVGPGSLGVVTLRRSR